MLADHQVGSAMTIRLHRLKCWPEFFHEILTDRLTACLRKNDRDYRVGDWLELREYAADLKYYSGATLYREITHIIAPPHAVLPSTLTGHVLLSIKSAGYGKLPNDTDIQVIEPKANEPSA